MGTRHRGSRGRRQTPGFEPREYQSEQRAKIEAGSLVNTYPAVIAWSRTADPNLGEYDEPEMLFWHGDVPDIE